MDITFLLLLTLQFLLIFSLSENISRNEHFTTRQKNPRARCIYNKNSRPKLGPESPDEQNLRWLEIFSHGTAHSEVMILRSIWCP